MKEINVTIGQWYVVEGAAGDTITNPSTGRAIATVEEGKQASFYATSAVVVASSDSVQVHRANFKSAPAKLMALGLLGGGASTGILPAGYIAADFLESTGTQWIKVNLPVKPSSHFKFRAAFRNKNAQQSVYSISAELSLTKGYGFALTGGKPYPYSFAFNSSSQLYKNLELSFSTPYQFETDGYKIRFNDVEYSFPEEPSKTFNNFFLFAIAPHYGQYVEGREVCIYNFEYSDEANLKLTPCVDNHGVPCMFDKVSKQPFYNNGTGSFIVGLTLAQARKLGKLPSTGGTLTISLPEGYEADAGVVSALDTARANGWTLTIQTYTPENVPAGASTFALRRIGVRRIWVRRTVDENGMYVDADGTRWQVDWCVDMLTPDGSTPDAHGYELFRSVEAAVAYWELEPWVDPEAEAMYAQEKELLTNSTTNEHE